MGLSFTLGERQPNGERRTVNAKLLIHLESSRSHIIFPLSKNAPLAQLAEQVTLNHWVVGSIPTRCMPQPEGLTTEKKR